MYKIIQITCIAIIRIIAAVFLWTVIILFPLWTCMTHSTFEECESIFYRILTLFSEALVNLASDLSYIVEWWYNRPELLILCLISLLSFIMITNFQKPECDDDWVAAKDRTSIQEN